MNWSCRQAEERMTDAVDARLGESERARFEAHVAGCEGCRRSLGSLRAQRRTLLQIGTESAPSALIRNLRSKIASESYLREPSPVAGRLTHIRRMGLARVAAMIVIAGLAATIAFKEFQYQDSARETLRADRSKPRPEVAVGAPEARKTIGTAPAPKDVVPGEAVTPSAVRAPEAELAGAPTVPAPTLTSASQRFSLSDPGFESYARHVARIEEAVLLRALLNRDREATPPVSDGAFLMEEPLGKIPSLAMAAAAPDLDLARLFLESEFRRDLEAPQLGLLGPDVSLDDLEKAAKPEGEISKADAEGAVWDPEHPEPKPSAVGGGSAAPTANPEKASAAGLAPSSPAPSPTPRALGGRANPVRPGNETPQPEGQSPSPKGTGRTPTESPREIARNDTASADSKSKAAERKEAAEEPRRPSASRPRAGAPNAKKDASTPGIEEAADVSPTPLLDLGKEASKSRRSVPFVVAVVSGERGLEQVNDLLVTLGLVPVERSAQLAKGQAPRTLKLHLAREPLNRLISGIESAPGVLLRVAESRPVAPAVDFDPSTVEPLVELLIVVLGRAEPGG